MHTFTAKDVTGLFYSFKQEGDGEEWLAILFTSSESNIVGRCFQTDPIYILVVNFEFCSWLLYDMRLSKTLWERNFVRVCQINKGLAIVRSRFQQ